MMRGTILVAGSINMDIVNGVQAFPAPGETITGLGTAYHPGGKGANQAVAAARSGCPVVMLGAVGTDLFGKSLLASLSEEGIKTEEVIIKAGSSGMAFITVNSSGENTIVLSPGSNGLLVEQDIPEDRLNQAGMLLLQNEIPWPTNLYLMEQAGKRGIPVLYNAAPAHKLTAVVLPLIDTLIMNETEAESVTGEPVANVNEASHAASLLVSQGVRHVVITLGNKGCFYMDDEGIAVHQPAFEVEALDTTAAGDTFIGAYASALHKAKNRLSALLYASAASAIAVTRRGAQSSVPDEQEIELFLLQRINGQGGMSV
ncbi:ribokinase [Paenibacillus sp. NPDC058174]|uniref:ribokinase n=1 Tax=Paenibacillus sp. NPDC058174 TaxID=3346366 RepID=UPI0036DF0950